MRGGGIAEGSKERKTMKECENCDYSDIAGWEQDKKTGKANPIYWCEKYKKHCMDIKECQHISAEGSENEDCN